LETRVAGARAFEWVPWVEHESRPAIESMLQRNYPGQNAEFKEHDASGAPRRAADRPSYYPVCYSHPLGGNEAALGYDLKTGPTSTFLEQARETRQMRVTHQIRLVQEPANQLGVVMVWPVFRTARTPSGALQSMDSATDGFAGFLQCVFRVQDLLANINDRQPGTILDVLFVDMSESAPAKRALL
jgi:CHASE1-domain containing sensor protein